MPRNILYSVGIGPDVQGVTREEFAAKIAQVLSDPRGWRKYGFEFREVPEREGAVHVRLESSDDAASLCGISGFSCWRERPADIVINLGNWMGGSRSQLPLDRYRTYVINHEWGHALGLEHQKCPAAECTRRGMTTCPASVMQQMTRGAEHIAPCVEADWPLDPDWRIDDPTRRPRGGPSASLVLLVFALVIVLVACLISAVTGGSSRSNAMERSPC